MPTTLLSLPDGIYKREVGFGCQLDSDDLVWGRKRYWRRYGSITCQYLSCCRHFSLFQ